MKNGSIRLNICLAGILGSKNTENRGETTTKEILAKNLPELSWDCLNFPTHISRGQFFLHQ